MNKEQEEKDVIFIFSSEQMESITNIYTKLGKKVPKKYIIVKGKPRQYTDIIDDENKIKFSDSIIVIKGKKSKMSLIER